MTDNKDDPLQGKVNWQHFYDENDPQLSDDAKALFTQYSGIPEAELIPHLRTIRDKAWHLYKYPCVGQYSFLRFGISRDPLYPSLIPRLQQGQTLLDLACCFGQDMRRLVFDGVPAAQLTGAELEAGFVGLGYELFRDEGRLDSRFITGDFFDESILSPDRHQFDLIHAASFFHLFSWAEQVQTVTKALRLLKPKAGSMLFGRQTAVAQAGALPLPATRSGEMYRHTPDSWRQLLEQVVEQMEIQAACSAEPAGEQKLTAGVGVWNVVRFRVELK